MEKAPTINNSHNLYPMVRNTGTQHPSLNEVTKQSDGTMIHPQEILLHRWAKHFKEQFNWPKPTVVLAPIATAGNNANGYHSHQQWRSIREMGFLKRQCSQTRWTLNLFNHHSSSDKTVPNNDMVSQYTGFSGTRKVHTTGQLLNKVINNPGFEVSSQLCRAKRPHQQSPYSPEMWSNSGPTAMSEGKNVVVTAMSFLLLLESGTIQVNAIPSLPPSKMEVNWGDGFS